MTAFLTQEVPLADRLFGWWYRIAAPPEVPEEAPLRLRMRVRSGRLASVIFLFVILNLLGTLTVFLLVGLLVSALLVVIGFIVLLIGIILNHRGKTTTAAILFIVYYEMLMITTFFYYSKGGLTGSFLPIFDFFTASEVMAASLLVPWATLPLTLGNCLISIALITFLPKAPDLVYVLHKGAYIIYSNAIQIQIFVAVMAFLWVSSTYREMKRANSAEEVSKLTMALAKAEQGVRQEKRQIEMSIEQIVSVHMQVANGNLSARVPFDQQNVLWAVAGSLNNLLARLQSWRFDAVQFQKNEEGIQQLLENLQKAQREGKPFQAYTTGTSLDAVIREISKGVVASQPSSPWSIKQEKKT